VLNGFQVATGLLLLSATSSTSMAEERMRGSLDVLLTTPLSTREIVTGKWWGTFRLVPPLALIPALAIGLIGVHDDFALQELIAIGWLTVFGAAPVVFF